MFHCIVFETADDITTDQLHEALCKAAHEGSTDELASIVQSVEFFDTIMKEAKLPR